MTIATLGALAIGELPEAASVMLFYRTGEFLQGLAVDPFPPLDPGSDSD